MSENHVKEYIHPLNYGLKPSGLGAPRVASVRDLVPTGPLVRTLAATYVLWKIPFGVAYALPQNGQVVEGQVDIRVPNQSTMELDQSTRGAVINWDSFDVDPDESIWIFQPTADSWLLNRVNDGGASQILGQIQANGGLTLINPAGITVGNNARIDVGRLILSTQDIENDAFMQGVETGRFSFGGAGLVGMLTGTVENYGDISVADGGLAALVAPYVVNQGVIQADLGKIVLAGTNHITVDFYGDDLIHFGADAIAADVNVQNSGVLQANGGSVVMTATAAAGVIDNVINMSGTIVADTVVEQEGEIILFAGHGGAEVSGSLQAQGDDAHEQGGLVDVRAEYTNLLAGAEVNTGGLAGGGSIKIGGDYQGNLSDGSLSDPGNRHQSADSNGLSGGLTGGLGSVQSQRTSIAGGASLLANAGDDGDGGDVIVWGEDRTDFYGHIEAKGGSLSGDGGLAEVSGKQSLAFRGAADLTADNGNRGGLLLDPYNISIQSGTSTTSLSGGVFYDTVAGSVLDPSDLLNVLHTADVTVQASGAIVVDDPIAVTVGSYDLSLTAGSNIRIRDNITVGGSFNAVAGTYIYMNSNGASISAGGGINLTASSGDLEFTGDKSFTFGQNSTFTGDLNPVEGGALTFNANGADLTIVDTITNGSLTVNTGGGNVSFGGAIDVEYGSLLITDNGTGTGTVTLPSAISVNGTAYFYANTTTNNQNLSLVLSKYSSTFGQVTITKPMNVGTGTLNIDVDASYGIGSNYVGSGTNQTISLGSLANISATTLNLSATYNVVVYDMTSTATSGTSNIYLTANNGDVTLGDGGGSRVLDFGSAKLVANAYDDVYSNVASGSGANGIYLNAGYNTTQVGGTTLLGALSAGAGEISLTGDSHVIGASLSGSGGLTATADTSFLSVTTTGAISMGGDVSLNATDGATVIGSISSDSNVNVSASGANGIVVSGSGSIVGGGNVTLSASGTGDLLINAGATVESSGGNMLLQSGASNGISLAGTASLSGSGYELRIDSNEPVSLSGTASAVNGTVAFHDPGTLTLGSNEVPNIISSTELANVYASELVFDAGSNLLIYGAVSSGLDATGLANITGGIDLRAVGTLQVYTNGGFSTGNRALTLDAADFDIRDTVDSGTAGLTIQNLDGNLEVGYNNTGRSQHSLGQDELASLTGGSLSLKVGGSGNITLEGDSSSPLTVTNSLSVVNSGTGTTNIRGNISVGGNMSVDSGANVSFDSGATMSAAGLVIGNQSTVSGSSSVTIAGALDISGSTSVTGGDLYLSGVWDLDGGGTFAATDEDHIHLPANLYIKTQSGDLSFGNSLHSDITNELKIRTYGNDVSVAGVIGDSLNPFEDVFINKNTTVGGALTATGIYSYSDVYLNISVGGVQELVAKYGELHLGGNVTSNNQALTLEGKYFDIGANTSINAGTKNITLASHGYLHVGDFFFNPSGGISSDELSRMQGDNLHIKGKGSYDVVLGDVSSADLAGFSGNRVVVNSDADVYIDGAKYGGQLNFTSPYAFDVGARTLEIVAAEDVVIDKYAIVSADNGVSIAAIGSGSTFASNGAVGSSNGYVSISAQDFVFASFSYLYAINGNISIHSTATGDEIVIGDTVGAIIDSSDIASRFISNSISISAATDIALYDLNLPEDRNVTISAAGDLEVTTSTALDLAGDLTLRSSLIGGAGDLSVSLEGNGNKVTFDGTVVGLTALSIAQTSLSSGVAGAYFYNDVSAGTISIGNTTYDDISVTLSGAAASDVTGTSFDFYGQQLILANDTRFSLSGDFDAQSVATISGQETTHGQINGIENGNQILSVYAANVYFNAVGADNKLLSVVVDTSGVLGIEREFYTTSYQDLSYGSTVFGANASISSGTDKLILFKADNPTVSIGSAGGAQVSNAILNNYSGQTLKIRGIAGNTFAVSGVSSAYTVYLDTNGTMILTGTNTFADTTLRGATVSLSGADLTFTDDAVIKGDQISLTSSSTLESSANLSINAPVDGGSGTLTVSLQGASNTVAFDKAIGETAPIAGLYVYAGSSASGVNGVSFARDVAASNIVIGNSSYDDIDATVSGAAASAITGTDFTFYGRTLTIANNTVFNLSGDFDSRSSSASNTNTHGLIEGPNFDSSLASISAADSATLIINATDIFSHHIGYTRALAGATLNGNINLGSEFNFLGDFLLGGDVNLADNITIVVDGGNIVLPSLYSITGSSYNLNLAALGGGNVTSNTNGNPAPINVNVASLAVDPTTSGFSLSSSATVGGQTGAAAAALVTTFTAQSVTSNPNYTAPAPSPGGGPTPPPTFEPTPEPTFLPTPEPTFQPTPEPTFQPTPEPTFQPTPEPTFQPTPEPTFQPTPEPTFQPTPEPTPEPITPRKILPDPPPPLEDPPIVPLPTNEPLPGEDPLPGDPQSGGTGGSGEDTIIAGGGGLGSQFDIPGVLDVMGFGDSGVNTDEDDDEDTGAANCVCD